MNRFIIFLLLTLFSLVLNAQWRNTTPLPSELYDITFTDDYTGYATAQSGAIGNCSGYELSLFRTIDAGENWIRMKTGTTGQIRAVHFANQLVGWTAGASSEILKTTDGGATWSQVSYGVGSGYNDIWFRDVNNGFVLGDNGMLRKSNNGGLSWQTIASGVTTTLKKIHFYDNNLGFITCSDGKLLKTINGGSSWTIVSSGATWGVDVFFVSSTTGYHMGSDNGTTNLYKTTDGGANWTALPIGYSYLRRLFFTSEDVGYIITWGFGILKTTDGGETWTQIMTMNGIYDNWSGIHFTDDNTGYISGKLGRINKTTDGGLTWKNKMTGLSDDLSAVEAPQKDTAYFADIDGKILKTENGGISYKQQTGDQGADITKLHFFNTISGLAAVGDGNVLKTVDGGENWVPQITNTTRRLTDFSFISDQVGFASSFGGVIFKTTDAGATWDSIPSGFDEYLTDICFINQDTGYALSSSKIIRTFDGGINWSIYDPSISGLMRDIKFYNSEVGYVVSSGKVLITRNYGDSWELQSSYSGTIHEMELINDSTAFYTYNTSQRMSLDSGKTLYSLPTACLHNNWSMFDLSMTNEGDYGYSVGGISGLIHQTENTEIIASIVSKTSSFCPGTKIFVGFLGKGFYGAGNIFMAQLSDASGNFGSPTSIGSVDLSAVTIYKAGIITATIPVGTPSGNGYRIRVVASNPSLISPDNGTDISIQSSTTPAVSLLNISSSSCEGSDVLFTTNTFAGGMNPNYQWTINENVINHNASTLTIDSLLDGDSVKVRLTSSLGCVNTDSAHSNVVVTNFSASSHQLSLSDSICVGDSILLYGVYQNSAGIYYDSLQTVSGCDSVMSTTLSINTGFSSNQNQSICQGDSILLYGIYQNSAGIYYDSLQTINGCDSILSTTLTVNSTFLFNQDQSICQNDSILLYGVYQNSAGIYYDSLQTINGCDSLYSTNLTVNVVFSSNQSESICEGDSILLYGVYQNTAGVYYDSLETISNCDSILSTTLTVNPLPTVTLASFNPDTVCIDAALPVLPDGTPVGGTYTGTGVSGTNFDPQLAGAGTHDIIYTYTDGNLCANSDTSVITVDVCTGIESMRSDFGILIYPNPNSGLFTIEKPTDLNETVQIRVLDASAKLIVEKSIVEGQQKIEVDITAYSSGLYYLQLTVGEEVFVKQILKD